MPEVASPVRRLLPTTAAAAYLSISETMLRKLTAAGKLPRVKVGEAARWDVSDLDAYIRRQKSGGQQG